MLWALKRGSHHIDDYSYSLGRRGVPDRRTADKLLSFLFRLFQVLSKPSWTFRECRSDQVLTYPGLYQAYRLLYSKPQLGHPVVAMSLQPVSRFPSHRFVNHISSPVNLSSCSACSLLRSLTQHKRADILTLSPKREKPRPGRTSAIEGLDSDPR